MTYKQTGNQVTIEMEAREFSELLVMIGYAAGSCAQKNDLDAMRAIRVFVNDILKAQYEGRIP